MLCGVISCDLLARYLCEWKLEASVLARVEALKALSSTQHGLEETPARLEGILSLGPSTLRVSSALIIPVLHQRTFGRPIVLSY